MSVRVMAALLPALVLSAAVVQAQAAPPTEAAATFDLQAFQGNAWILGRWRGAGFGRLASVGEFHEEYVLVNDSTVLMRSYERAPFQAATDSTWFEYRSGRIRAVPTRGSTRFVTRVAGDTIFWSGAGVRYVRISETLWRALIPMPGTAGEHYYEMRRMMP